MVSKKEMMTDKQIMGYLNKYIEECGWTIYPDPDDEINRIMAGKDQEYNGITAKSAIPSKKVISTLIMNSPIFHKQFIKYCADLLAESFIEAHRDVVYWLWENETKEKCKQEKAKKKQEQATQVQKLEELMAKLSVENKKELKQIMKQLIPQPLRKGMPWV